MERINNLARKHSERAITMLVNIMEDEANPTELRMKAAQAILDRGIGKPTAHIVAENQNHYSADDDFLAALKAIAEKRKSANLADVKKLTYATIAIDVPGDVIELMPGDVPDCMVEVGRKNKLNGGD